MDLSMIPGGRGRAGWTLLELLAVVAIIAILAALLLPVVAKSKDRAARASCANNMRQWGAAVTMYAGDNKNHFPDNSDGAGLSWCGDTMQAFWTNYLARLSKSDSSGLRTAEFLFCPTEKWHRAANLLTNTGYGSQISIGYFYLPARDPLLAFNQQHAFNYDIVGLGGWATRKQLGGEFRNAPIMMDQKCGTGRIGAGAIDWFGVIGLGDQPNKRLPYSNHVQPAGEPNGGNFLYEDGSVRWFENEKIEPACTADNWVFFYKVPVE